MYIRIDRKELEECDKYNIRNYCVAGWPAKVIDCDFIQMFSKPMLRKYLINPAGLWNLYYFDIIDKHTRRWLIP